MIIHFSVWRKMAPLELRPLLITNLMPLFTLSAFRQRMSIMQLPKVILLSKYLMFMKLFQMCGTWGAIWATGGKIFHGLEIFMILILVGFIMILWVGCIVLILMKTVHGCIIKHLVGYGLIKAFTHIFIHLYKLVGYICRTQIVMPCILITPLRNGQNLRLE